MTSRRWIGDERGFTLLMVLVMVVLLGLALSLAGQTWKDVMQQAREKELFWRGDQYRKAIASYHKVTHGGLQSFPARLEDLVRDPRFLEVRRHIRRLYLDPMTGKDFIPVKDPAGHIVGVRSSSDLKPFRQSGFPKGYENFEGRDKYSEWQFVFTEPAPKKPQGPPTSTSTSTSTSAAAQPK